MDREPERLERDAELTDATIDALLARGPVPDEAPSELVDALRQLAVVHRPAVPDGVAEAVQGRVGSERRRHRWLALGVRAAALALAALFTLQGIPSVFASGMLAEFLGLVHEPHIYGEVGILTLGLAVGLVAAAVRPRLLPGVLAVALPAAFGLGIFGMLEIPHSPNPGAEVLHIGQATVAVCLVVVWLAWRRRA